MPATPCPVLLVACEDGVTRAWTRYDLTGRIGTVPVRSYARPTRTLLWWRVRGILACGFVLFGVGDLVRVLWCAWVR